MINPKLSVLKEQMPGNLLSLLEEYEGRLRTLESMEGVKNNYLGGDFGVNSIDDSGVHTNADVVDINWWLPLTLASDDMTVISTAVLRTIGGVKYLYVGGLFARIGGVTAANVARYNFASRAWEAVGGGVNNYVLAIAFDSADNLYIGGVFTNAGGDATADYIARLSGGAWVNVGGGVNSVVYAIAFDSANNLYIGGFFTNAGGDATADYIAKLVSGAWVNVGGGVNSVVYAIAFDSANNLYIGGGFTDAGGDAGADYIARLSGGAWVNVGGGVNSNVFVVAFDGADNLYIGGAFTNAGGDALADYVAELSGGAWVNVGGGVNSGIYAMAFDGADNLYVGGLFTDVSDIPEADRIAKFDRAQWSALSNGGGLSGLDGYVYAIAVDNATGNVYAGGSFDTAGTIQAKSIAVFTKSLSEAIDLLANMPEVLSAKIEAEIAAHIANTSNPHAVTAAQVGAGAYTDTTAWTVNVYGTTTRGTCTYTTREANYARVGNMVFISLYVNWTGHTGTGNLRLDVLPVAATSTSAFALYFHNITLGAVGNKLMATTSIGATYIIITEVGSGAATAVPMDAAGVLFLSGFYFV